MPEQAKGMRGLLATAGSAGACLRVLPFCLPALLFVASASSAPPSSSIVSLQADDANLAAKSRSAVLELYSLDARLTNAQHRLAVLRSAETRLRAQRAILTRELRAARTDTHLSQLRLATRLRFMYEHRSTTSLDLVMGARSLEDVLTQLDDYDRIATSNLSVLVQVRSARHRFVRFSGELSARERSLAAATRGASEEVSRLEQLTNARRSYISQLADRRSLDASKIAQLTSAAEAADARAQELAAAPRAPQVVTTRVSIPQVTMAAGGGTITVTATGYDLPGHTATGLPVGWGIAAVDPSVIPLGTHIVIPGYGEAIAADTGPSIHGSMIDLWFPTPQQAYRWGRRTITVSLN